MEREQMDQDIATIEEALSLAWAGSRSMSDDRTVRNARAALARLHAALREKNDGT